ncbi:hypothetical protein JCM21900_002748 [Sporobolomyces salmonicolor]
MESEDKMDMAIDVGNSYSSVSLTHVAFCSQPLSPSPTAATPLRTVFTYPFSNPTLAPISSRTPSFIYYDRTDRPRAFGADSSKSTSGEPKKLLKKSKVAPLLSPPSGSVLTASDGLGLLHAFAAGSTKSFSPELNFPSFRSLRSVAPEGLRDATDGLASTRGGSSSPSLTPTTSKDGKEGKDKKDKKYKKDKKDEKERLYQGPKLREIYAEHMKHLVACTRAFFAESEPDGESTFLRLWPSCVFVISHPADWTVSETNYLREAMEEANLIPPDFAPGKLMFVKEPAAITYFSRSHTKDAEGTWLQNGESFALCDAAELRVSIVGYTVTALKPRLKLRTYEPMTCLPFGAFAVLTASESSLARRLAKTKFKSSIFTTTLVDEFRAKVLPKFSGVGGGGHAFFRLRIVSEGMEKEVKGATAIDAEAKTRDGWMTLSGQDVEGVFKLSIDAIVVRLASVVPKGRAKHIVLAGGFGESPYLVRRLRETFEPQGVHLVIPEIPTHTAVSEGSLRFYLSETLRPRATRFRLGVEVALDWRTQYSEGMHERDVFAGSDGVRLIRGAFGTLVERGVVPDPARTFSKTFHMRYRPAAHDPTFSTTLWAQDVDSELAADGWMVEPGDKRRDCYRPVCQVTADLGSLVALSKVYATGEKAWVMLEIQLLVYEGETSLEAAVLRKEEGKEVRGQPSLVADEYF